MKKILLNLSLLIIGIIATSCSLFYPTISVEIPLGYSGWCYVIPVKDTPELNIKKNGKLYTINEYGVVYIPASVLDLKKDSKINVFGNGVDITGQDRYTASVNKHMDDGTVYDYIHFIFRNNKNGV